MSKIANGDLTVKIIGDTRRKCIKDAINQTIDSLNDIMSNVRNTVDEVTRGSLCKYQMRVQGAVAGSYRTSSVFQKK